MGFFKTLFRTATIKSTLKEKDNITQLGSSKRRSGHRSKLDASDTSRCSSKQSHSHSHSHSKSRKEHSKTKSSSKPIVSFVEVPVEKSANVKVAEAFLESWNKHGTTTTAEEILAFFVSGKCKVIIDDIPPMTARDIVDQLTRNFASFPDMHFSHKSIKELSSNRVVIESARCSGTHTGAPYTIAPGVLPEIPAEGTFCINDEENFELTLKDGKICQFQIVALGNVTGPPGFYEQIGGDVSPLSFPEQQ